MSDFLRAIQGDLVDAARLSFGDQWSPASLKPALAQMRQAYGAANGPDFSQPEIRLAYALASHPYHALMSYEVFSQCAHLLKCDHLGVFRATVLGAGAGAEAIALIRTLSEKVSGLQHISLTLVDRESGWSNTRRTTIEKTSKRWWNGQLTIHDLTADLATEEGRANTRSAITDSDLVIAQALLTEITQGDEAVNVLADLLTHFSADSLLLLCDFTKMRGLQEWIKEIDGNETLRTVLALQERFPMPSCHVDVKPLYADEPFLRERGQVTVTARLYSRPGWTPPSIEVDETFAPTEGQVAVLESFASFLKDEKLNTLILEGPAGTGKTEIVRQMAATAVAEGLMVSLWAPTGQAAVRLSSRTGLPASTVHSALFERTGRIDNDTSEREWPPTLVFARRDLDYSRHVVFIDEASMIGDHIDVDGDEPAELKFEDGRLLSHILKGVVEKNGRVVFVGDSCQLPPINEQFPIALSAPYLESLGCNVVETHLSEVRRTTDNSEILQLANKLREKVKLGEEDLQSVNPDSRGDVVITGSLDLAPFQIEQFRSGEAVALASRNIDVANANMLIRASLGCGSELPEPNDRMVLTKGNQIFGLMNGTDVCAVSRVGDVMSVQRHKRHEQITEVVHLQEVVLQMNLPSGDVLDFAATVVVDALGAASIDLLSMVRRVLWVDFIIRMRDLGLDKRDEDFWRMYESDVRANALLCSYGYARTTYRAQGGEWKSVFVDVHSLLPIRPGTSRQAYSAVTRSKSALYLRGWPRGVKTPMTHEELAEGPKSILQQALQRRIVSRPLPTAITTVQLSVEDGSSSLLLNLFDGAKGLNFHLDKASEEESEAVSASLELWKRRENVRHRREVPVRLEAGVSQLEEFLESRGIDLFVVKPGNATREIELHAFRDTDYAIFRSTWTDAVGLNLAKFRSHETNSPALSDLVFDAVREIFSA
jgi:hypothetical protein